MYKCKNCKRENITEPIKSGYLCGDCAYVGDEIQKTLNLIEFILKQKNLSKRDWKKRVDFIYEEGKKLSQIECLNCGYQRKEDDKFCSSCGEILEIPDFRKYILDKMINKD